MISSKVLFILLVLIYVTLSHEKDPEVETKSFSLKDATSKLKRLLKENLKQISNYGEEAKEKLKEWKNRKAESGNVEEDIKDLEQILNKSIADDFKEKEDALYKKLLSLTKEKQGNVEEKFEKFYEDTKSVLGGTQKFWKDQWNAASNLFKSGV